MVKKIKESCQCRECKLFYADILLAKKCEKWCKRHKSCNLEITKYAIKKEALR